MGVRNQKREILKRLDSKTLDAKFLVEIEQGLNCSPFEAEAVLEVVKEVYFPFIDERCAKAPPGKVTLVAISADEPAGKPVAECQKQSVCLTVHRGSEDDRLVQEQGSAGFRQARIPDLYQEALSQGALLTREDLAYRIPLLVGCLAFAPPARQQDAGQVNGQYHPDDDVQTQSFHGRSL